ncbi:MAG: hypothetical protein M3011_07190 [Actinomycetota bacterium]|nr:hypothetical protein [Actinomycetota bacterium]
MLAPWTGAGASGGLHRVLRLFARRVADGEESRWNEEAMMVGEQWLAFERNLDWVTAHFGHR